MKFNDEYIRAVSTRGRTCETWRKRVSPRVTGGLLQYAIVAADLAVDMRCTGVTTGWVARRPELHICYKRLISKEFYQV